MSNDFNLIEYLLENGFTQQQTSIGTLFMHGSGIAFQDCLWTEFRKHLIGEDAEEFIVLQIEFNLIENEAEAKFLIRILDNEAKHFN